MPAGLSCRVRRRLRKALFSLNIAVLLRRTSHRLSKALDGFLELVVVDEHVFIVTRRSAARLRLLTDLKLNRTKRSVAYVLGAAYLA